jgi:hypothetical protein
MAALVEWSKSTLALGGRKNRNDTGMLAVPAAVGLFVALGAGVYRRKRKPEQKSTQSVGFFKGRPY